MQILIDTNIILRIAEPAHPMHQAALRAVKKLFADGHDLCMVAQNLIEYWNVATRPYDKNGLGRTPAQTDTDLAGLESIFTLLPDTAAIYREWRSLVAAHSVAGKQVHDTRIVAAMNVHVIKNLLTFNIADFARFTEITVIDPTTT